MRVATISNGQESLDLGGQQVRLGAGVTGMGMPPVAIQWSEGAGDGANYRGARVLSRSMELPFKFYGQNRQEVWDLYSKVARLFAPRRTVAGPVQTRIEINLDGSVWYLDVVRTGGGDFSWEEDTDGISYLRSVFTVQAGDPYWTRRDENSHKVSPGGLGRGLLKMPSARLNALRVSTINSLGEATFDNPGDVEVYPTWRLNGPFTGFTLVSALGDRLRWVGNIAAGQYVDIDSALGTVVDHTGANRYSGLDPMPRFWSIPPGESKAEVTLDNASSGSIGPGALVARNRVKNPSAEVDLTGWTAWSANTNISRNTNEAFAVAGSSYIILSASTATSNFGGKYGPEPVAGGEFIAVQVTARSSSPAYARLRLEFFDAGGAFISPYLFGPVFSVGVGTAGYTDVVMFAQAPAGAVTMAVVIQYTDSNGSTSGTVAQGTQLILDAMAIWGSDTMEGAEEAQRGGYFDGSTPATNQYLHSWEGTAHASASIRSIATLVGESSAIIAYRPRKWVLF